MRRIEASERVAGSPRATATTSPNDRCSPTSTGTARRLRPRGAPGKPVPVEGVGRMATSIGRRSRIRVQPQGRFKIFGRRCRWLSGAHPPKPMNTKPTHLPGRFPTALPVAPKVSLGRGLRAGLFARNMLFRLATIALLVGSYAGIRLLKHAIWPMGGHPPHNLLDH